MNHEDVPVLIVGGSLVGLSTAVFLGHHGVPSLVLERHRGTAIHPRAALVNQRTMETYRAVGLEEEIEEAAAREFVQNGAIVSVDSLGGNELDWYFRFINEGVEDLSPSARIFITQIGLEPVLLRAAERVGAEIRYASEAVSVDQDESGVTAVVKPREGGPERTVRARYLIAADGAHSPIRERLGIQQLGHGSFSDSITIYFRADVRRLMGDRNLSVIYVFGPGLQGFFRFSIDLQAGFLVVNSTVDAEGTRSVQIGEDMSTPTCIAHVREALGDPEIEVEIENVQRWSASAEYAARLQAGRIFLAGDSAHVMPPTGGFGGNCGVQDGYDLAWKLAYVLDGRADDALLATYDAERQPVGAFTTEQAYTRYVLRLDPSLGKDDLQPIVPEAPVELGYRHRSPAVVVGADDDGATWEDPATPSGRPGFRAPHVPVTLDGVARSSLDLFGSDFVVLAGSEGASWCSAASAAGAALGVAVRAHRIGTDVSDATGARESV
jgi:2-polyprenyl-6-methoxyphenol hydroxylase-like FAD-dependent oxidoreductase